MFSNSIPNYSTSHDWFVWIYYYELGILVYNIFKIYCIKTYTLVPYDYYLPASTSQLRATTCTTPWLKVFNMRGVSNIAFVVVVECDDSATTAWNLHFSGRIISSSTHPPPSPSPLMCEFLLNAPASRILNDSGGVARSTCDRQDTVEWLAIRTDRVGAKYSKLTVREIRIVHNIQSKKLLNILVGCCLSSAATFSWSQTSTWPFRFRFSSLRTTILRFVLCFFFGSSSIHSKCLFTLANIPFR